MLFYNYDVFSFLFGFILQQFTGSYNVAPYFVNVSTPPTIITATNLTFDTFSDVPERISSAVTCESRFIHSVFILLATLNTWQHLVEHIRRFVRAEGSIQDWELPLN